MIKKLELSQIDRVMNIWLESNVSAHDFIPRQYWDTNYEVVKQALPEATVYIYEDEHDVQGFIGIIDRSYIAGLFVTREARSNGIGSRLIGVCKEESALLDCRNFNRTNRVTYIILLHLDY